MEHGHSALARSWLYTPYIPYIPYTPYTPYTPYIPYIPYTPYTPRSSLRYGVLYELMVSAHSLTLVHGDCHLDNIFFSGEP
jgi:hypothetical protein